jgi:hypothetical protein
MIRFFVLAVVMTWAGLLGAGAFNPDDGSVLRSEALWRIFGLGAYFGMAILYGIPLFLAGRLVVRALRRLCPRGRTDAGSA